MRHSQLNVSFFSPHLRLPTGEDMSSLVYFSLPFELLILVVCLHCDPIFRPISAAAAWWWSLCHGNDWGLFAGVVLDVTMWWR